MATYANQKIVTIHKDKYYQDFLQIGKDEWQHAFADLTRGTFGLYLYLSGNMDGYRFGLSSAAFQQATGVSDSTYRRAVEELLVKGYLIKNGGTYDFYLTPQPTDYVPKETKRKQAQGN